MRKEHSPSGDHSTDPARPDPDSPGRQTSKAWMRESYRANYDLSVEDERNVFGSSTVDAKDQAHNGG